MKKHRLINISLAILSLLIIAFFTIRRHADTGYFNWRAELWADQTGYYVYLPGLFIYQYDAEDLPEDIVNKTGTGFEINDKNKIQTKYTYGVALLEAPIFLLIHAHTLTTEHSSDGFSMNYHYVPVISAILFAFIGFLYLFRFLGYYFNSKGFRYLILLLIFFATNLYMYVVDYSGMSHIYSFALISIFLYLLKKEFSEEAKWRRWIILSFIFALIVLIRPTNIIFGLLFFIDCKSIQDIRQRLNVFNLRKIISSMLIMLAVFIPQLIYWKVVFGNWIKYSYEGEGFIYWDHPRLLETIFSPNNGILLYAPITLIIVLGLIYMFRKKIENALLISVLLILTIYITASWHIYSFGAGFGCRHMVELFAVLSLPLAYIVKYFLDKRNMAQRLLLFSVIIAFLFLTQKLAYSYDRAYLGKGNWDFEEYKRLILHKKYHHIAFNGKDQLFSSSEDEMSRGVWIKPSDVAFTRFSTIEIICDIEGLNMKKDELLVIFYAYSGEEQIANYSKQINLRTGERKTERIKFGIPAESGIDDVLGVQIYNINGDEFILKKLTIKYS